MISKILSWFLGSGSSQNPEPKHDQELEKEERKSEPNATNSDVASSAPPAQLIVNPLSPRTENSNAKQGHEIHSTQTAPPTGKNAAEAGTAQVAHAPVGRLRKAPQHRPPIELRLGLDVGTSCTKAVISNVETGTETVIPMAGKGSALRDFLLPTRVFLNGERYSLSGTDDSKLITNLKLKLLDHSAKGKRPAPGDLEPLVAFVALTLRRVLGWHSQEYSAVQHPGRLAIWSLSVGLPSKRATDDVFAPIYTTVVRAAVILAESDSDVTSGTVTGAIENTSVQPAWVPHGRISLFPEASAQLVSLLNSPFCPQGCLLLVDVGAGTLDVSTLRVSTSNVGARCFIQCSDVAPLGVHFLQIERQGLTNTHSLDLSAEDVIRGYRASRVHEAEERFTKRCRETLLATVARYRKLLRGTHVSPTFQPWKEGLTYILSGGGHRDPFYQELIKMRLRDWMQPLVGEWTDDMPGLKPEPFRAPNSFGPVFLKEHFDRFSVAHGLSLDPANLLTTGEPQ